MCSICGCGHTSAADADAPHHHHHHHDHDTGHDHADHGAAVEAQGPLGAAHAAGTTPSRIVSVEQDLLAENNRFAAANRSVLAGRGILALNLMSGPGAGKTTLLVRTVGDLRRTRPVAVIEGDQQTGLDAERIRATGAPAVQINTGKGCHLDAHMVGHAVERLSPEPGSLLFIENVGNLVCPAGFDLGEAARVVLLSVTEGDDKPLKYPDMFATADLMVVTKIDLLPHVEFDLERCIRLARQIRPGLEVQSVSAKTGQGLDTWYRWIEARGQVDGLVAAAVTGGGAGVPAGS